MCSALGHMDGGKGDTLDTGVHQEWYSTSGAKEECLEGGGRLLWREPQPSKGCGPVEDVQFAHCLPCAVDLCIFSRRWHAFSREREFQ